MFAALPTWMVFVLLIMLISSIGRWFGGGASRSRRHWKQLGLADPDTVARLQASIEERDGVIEDLQHRLSELESRLDFTERLLAERRNTEVLHGEQR